MNATARALVRVGFISCFLVACATTAFAQTRVRVTRDQAPIWNQDFASAADVVAVETILTVVGRRGDWYEVILPGQERMGGAPTGFIFKLNVEVVKAPAAAASFRGTAAQPPPSTMQSRTVGVWGFGQFSYTRFAAHNSFEAVLSQPGGAFLGGGGELRLKGRFFVNGSVERFRKTGHRVFVLDGEVFRLGTPATITMLPVALTAGWRFENRRATPYAGGGVGRVFYKERSSFADDSENVDDRFTSYHALAGIEFRNQWVATAFEVQYSQVPDALGRGGASLAFGESNLGGLAGRIKILLGR